MITKKAWLGITMILAWSLVRVTGAETAPEWPDGTPQQNQEEIFGLRLRVARELRGDQAGEKFLREAFARDPRPEVKAFMAWVCFFGKGWGMPSLVDPDRGEKLALEAIGEGSTIARDIYGRAIGQGLIIGKGQAEALRWVKEAAADRVPRSLARLGHYTAIGWGVPADVPAGLALARQAAELGLPDGLVEIAGAYEKGRIGGKPDLDAALALYAEAAKHRDEYSWGRLNELGKTNPRARLLTQIVLVHGANQAVWMMPSKGRGLVKELEAIAGDDPAALMELGEVHLEGYYGKRDHAKALELFERAAAKGDTDAKFFLAKMQLRGWARPKDTAAGLAGIRQLADEGNCRAAAYLGYVHYWGANEAPGIKKDEEMAFRYVRRAAEKGDAWSLVNLGACYEHGIGTPENYGLAAKIYWQAFLRGYQPGLEKTSRLLKFVK
jgi:TPR repeat protein